MVFVCVVCRFFDDLRPYAVVQFVPIIAIPVMAILLPPMYTHSTYWLWAAGESVSAIRQSGECGSEIVYIFRVLSVS